MRVGRTSDPELIKEAITHPAVWDACTDDSAGSACDYVAPIHPDIITLAVYDFEQFGGVFIFVRQNAVLYECHARLLPSVLGSKAIEAGKLALDWMWQGSPAWRIMAAIPVENPKAVQFAIKSGFEVFGLNPRSWGKNGRLQDCLMLGISRPVEV